MQEMKGRGWWAWLASLDDDDTLCLQRAGMIES